MGVEKRPEVTPGIPGPTVVSQVSPNWITTRVDFLVNWARSNSLWPMPFATACCGIEFMAVAAARYDIARFGLARRHQTERCLSRPMPLMPSYAACRSFFPRKRDSVENPLSL